MWGEIRVLANDFVPFSISVNMLIEPHSYTILLNYLGQLCNFNPYYISEKSVSPTRLEEIQAKPEVKLIERGVQ